MVNKPVCFTSNKTVVLIQCSSTFHLTNYTPLETLCGFCNNTFNSGSSDLQCSLGVHILPVNFLRSLCFHSRASLVSLLVILPPMSSFIHSYCSNYLFMSCISPDYCKSPPRSPHIRYCCPSFKAEHPNANPVYPTKLPRKIQQSFHRNFF